jgi:hypothetical protein
MISDYNYIVIDLRLWIDLIYDYYLDYNILIYYFNYFIINIFYLFYYINISYLLFI